jgi:hypothetical protein
VLVADIVYTDSQQIKLSRKGLEIREMEEWRDIAGTRNRYQVSSLGRVKSLSYNKTGVEQILSQKEAAGYYRVSVDNKRQSVHRLVALAFIPNPTELPEVDHISRDTKDNRIENLRWASKSLNAINRKSRENNTGFCNINLTTEKTYRVYIRRDDSC